MTTTKKTELLNVEDLIKVKKSSVISTFSDTKKIQPFIDLVRDEVISDVVDLSTKKGRDKIASRAYKVSTIKNGVIKKIVNPSMEDYKQAIKSVGQGKSFFENEMDSLRDEIRKPLNDWEADEKEKEEKRIADIKEQIAGVIELGALSGEDDKDYITSMIEAVDNIDCTDGFDEFTQEALQAKSAAKEALAQGLNNIIQKELEEDQRLTLAAQQKKLDVQERLNNLSMVPVELIGKPSSDIKDKIDSLDKFEVTESDFGDLYQQAIDSVKKVIVQLKSMFNQQILIEEQARLMNIQNEDIPIDEVIDFTATHGIGIIDGNGKTSMAETMANAAPILSGMDMASGPDETVTLEMVTITQTELNQRLHNSYIDGWNDGVKAGLPYEECQELVGE